MSEGPLIAAVEAGGTKVVCAIGTGPDDIRDVAVIDTTNPKDTLHGITRFFSGARAQFGRFEAIGIGSFGPIDLDPKSHTYGYITTTPKRGWQHIDMVGPLKTQFKVPVGFDTDVNAAALGEYLWGSGAAKDPLIYLTVGTGIGGGVIVNGNLLHGLLHPEIGHLHVPPPTNKEVIAPECQCPFHKSCMEGYASGPAILKRWGVKPDKLPPDHPAWEDVSDVLAHGIVNLILTLSPNRIVLGGGVMRQTQIFELTRARVVRILNGYLQIPAITQHIEQLIVPPGLGERSGILGALALGQAALRQGR